MKMRINNDTGYGDLVMGDRGVARDGSLGTVAQILAHCDRRAATTDEIPDGTTDPRGYWADILDPHGFSLGSRVWLASSAKATPTTRRRVVGWLEEAFEPLVKTGVAERVRVTRVEPGGVRRGDVIAALTEFLEPAEPAPQWRPYWMEFDLGLA